ncbi:MAG: GNAT family N-acetyltransferase [Clostridia bacterium]|nr:GNAT family N-acetyltransferase [Clostridia bacterium]
MIRELTTFEPYWAFIDEINRDPSFGEPMLQTKEQIEKNLISAIQSPGQVPLGVFSDDEMTGLFVFLVVEDEQYIEMLVGLSRSPAAYEEIADWLQAHYPGYQVDFVFNPKNPAILKMLANRGAAVDSEQFKMVLTEEPPAVDTTGIEPLSPAYADQYVALHATDLYWTGERILKAPDMFRVFLAVDGGTVVGYIDVTKNNEENEPFDFLVREDCRRRGWGRKLLYKAIEANRPKRMMLIVDVGNNPAIALYRSMGFRDSPEPQSQAATLHLE